MELANFHEGDVSNIVKCKDCGCYFIKEDYEFDSVMSDYLELASKNESIAAPKGTDQDSVKTWSKKLRGREHMHGALQSTLRAFLKDSRGKAARNSKIKALDFGCGYGHWLKNLSSYNFIEAIGFDINEFKIQKVKENGSKATTNLEEIRSLGPYDIIVCNDVVEHIDNPIEAIDLINSLLAPGGVFYCAVPLFTHKDMRAAKAEMESGKRLKLFHTGHINYMTPEHFEKIMTKRGFQPVNTQSLTLPWAGGRPRGDEVKTFLKSLAKLMYFNISRKHCYTWLKK